MNMFAGWRSTLGNRGGNAAVAPGSNNSDGNNNNNQNNQNNNAKGGNQNNNNGNNNNSNNNNNNGNNTPNNDDLTNLWNDTPPTNNNNNGNNNNNNNNNNQNNQNNNNNNNGNKQQTFDEFVDAIDFGMGIKPEIAEKLKAGDLTVLPDLLNSTMRAAYKRAIQDASRLMDKNVKDAVAEAVNQSRGERNIDNLVGLMNTKLPFTDDALIAPVAKTVLGRALKQGKSANDAIEIVKKYFETVSNKAGGGKNNNQRLPGSGGFGNNDNDDVDFLALLSGQDQNTSAE